MEKEFSESSLNELIESLVPVYSKYMSLEDLQELIKFYETPFGKKYSEITPMLVKEIFLIGDEWVVNVGQDLEDKIKEKGYINEP